MMEVVRHPLNTGSMATGRQGHPETTDECRMRDTSLVDGHFIVWTTVHPDSFRQSILYIVAYKFEQYYLPMLR